MDNSHEKVQWGPNLTNLPLKKASFFQIVQQVHMLKAITMQYFPPNKKNKNAE